MVSRANTIKVLGCQFVPQFHHRTLERIGHERQCRGQQDGKHAVGQHQDEGVGSVHVGAAADGENGNEHQALVQVDAETPRVPYRQKAVLGDSDAAEHQRHHAQGEDAVGGKHPVRRELVALQGAEMPARHLIRHNRRCSAQAHYDPGDNAHSSVIQISRHHKHVVASHLTQQLMTRHGLHCKEQHKAGRHVDVAVAALRQPNLQREGATQDEVGLQEPDVGAEGCTGNILAQENPHGVSPAISAEVVRLEPQPRRVADEGSHRNSEDDDHHGIDVERDHHAPDAVHHRAPKAATSRVHSHRRPSDEKSARHRKQDKRQVGLARGIQPVHDMPDNGPTACHA